MGVALVATGVGVAGSATLLHEGRQAHMRALTAEQEPVDLCEELQCSHTVSPEGLTFTVRLEQ